MEPTNPPPLPLTERVVAITKGFERVIAFVLLLLLMIVVTLATAELGKLLYKDLFVSRETLLDVEHMFELFGGFLLIFVGLELLTSLKAYVRHGAVHVEVVLEVALVALAQKVIVLNPRSDPLKQF